jgi:hypothetical protein
MMSTKDPRLEAARAICDQTLSAFNKNPMSATLSKQHMNACFDYWRIVDAIRADRKNKKKSR